ncbi:MAG: 3'(2'),5'-bisphosphate nucleotidase CysQ [Gemmatimonadaceae bacterium]|nr:3'(2'),5'-bisphosphate nucleotidase CysQ [Gloeobacterales cyanobacterium ES-bin-141]
MNSSYTLKSWLPQIVEIAVEAGQAIMEIYAQPDLGTTYKEDNSPLTRADMVSHHIIVDKLRSLDPRLPVLSEESKSRPYQERETWSAFWLVDPIDGTKEFVKRNGEFTVNIALIAEGKPELGVVHAPALGITYWAAEGVGAFKQVAGVEAAPIHIHDHHAEETLKIVASRSHAGIETEAFLDQLSKNGRHFEVLSIGSSLKLCLVAEGAAHLYPRFGPTMEWDTAAAQCVVEQAGGQVVSMQGTRLRYNKAELLNPYFMVCGSSTLPWLDHIQQATRQQ